MRRASLLCRTAAIRGGRLGVLSSASCACRPTAFGAGRSLSFKAPLSFFGGHAATSTATAAAAQEANFVGVQHEGLVREAHESASLHSEQLLDACLSILELCGGPATGERPRLNLDHVSKETLWELADVLLHDFRRPPWEQYDLVYLSLCLPVALEDRHVHRSLMTILDAILPRPLYNVFASHNMVLSHDDEESMHKRHVLRVFMHAMLGDLPVPEGLQPEEVLLVHVDDFKTSFSYVAASPSFRALEGEIEGIAMRAKLFALLGRLCAEFDRENTGRVRLQELRETAERVLGSEKAALLLDGAPADKDGRIAYPQLAALLTRPPPKPRKAP